MSVRRSAVCLLVFVAVLATTLQGVAAVPARVVLRGAVPAWATAAHLRGGVPATRRLQFRVVLGWRHTDELRALLGSVTDPRSPDYGHYLSPAEFRARFSPPASEVNEVASWLRTQGLRVRPGPASGLWLQAGGTAQQIGRAFSTSINLYDDGGRVRRAPSAELTIPASLQGLVQTVDGLSGSSMRPVAEIPPPPSYTDAGPCSRPWGKRIASNKPKAYGHHRPIGPCGYTPRELQRAYGVADAIAAGNDGSGVTVAVIDAFADPRLVSDLQTYSAKHGLPDPVVLRQSFRPFKGAVHSQQGWFGEQALDVDAVHSMAPGATILYVGAKKPSTYWLNTALAWVLDNHAADLTTNSYGDLGESTQAEHDATEPLFQQAAAEGIGTYFSSGDDGDEIATIGHRSADYPASSPWVTAVGGTSLATAAGGAYRFETGWGTSYSRLDAETRTWSPAPPGRYVYGGGGGTSKAFAEPAYQRGVVPDALAGYFGGAGRVVPDIGIVGDPFTGMEVGQTQTFPDGHVAYGETAYGGTSLSSPLMAGIMALAQQRAGVPLGFVNPALYAAYRSDPSLVRDIVDPPSTVAVVTPVWPGGDPSSGEKRFLLATMNATGTLHTIPGYDDVTGIGTPNGEVFLSAFSP